MADLLAWVEGLRVLWYGLTGWLWRLAWDGEASGGVLVNVALTHRNSGWLGNELAVIDL